MSLNRDSRGVLHLGGVDLAVVLRDAGSPTYVYDLDAIAAEARDLADAFDGAAHLIAYAVKANTAGAVVRTLAAAGCGADIVSRAELRVALACGVDPERIVFSGVAKQDVELDEAIAAGARGIAAIQLESVEEVSRVAARARALGRTARVGVRINPGIDLEGATHAHIATGHDTAKFGVACADVTRAVELVESFPELALVGLGCHAGSQFMTLEPYLAAARVVFDIVRGLRAEGHLRTLALVDSGGGFGVDYGGGCSMRPADFVRAARGEQQARGLGDLELTVEPGRSLVGPHGVLLARVVQSKVAATGRWLMIDAGMNDLLRPALYQAHHPIVSLMQTPREPLVSWRVVGPVCESSDDFGAHVLGDGIPVAVAILGTGAYGYTMASVYNGRQLPVEVFVSAGKTVGRTTRRSVEDWAEERARAGI
jgi:diaminopimelate decarboxylase